jgi:hypothetical protein
MWNQAYQSHGIPAASGYQVLAGLTQPFFSTAFIARDYAESIHGQITDQSVVPKELRTSGDLAVLQRSPTGEIFEYHKNQPLEVSSFNNESFTFRVDHAYYWNLKLDTIDAKQIANIGQWIKAFQDDGLQKLSQRVDVAILHEMFTMAHPCNKGAKAGVRSRAYNLGTAGAPFVLNPSNFIRLIAFAQAVLSEQNAPNTNRFMVFPIMAQVIGYSHPLLANAMMSGLSRSTLLTGMVPDLLQFKLYFTVNTPTYTDPVLGTQTYAIVFGVKSATGFVNQLTKTEIIDKDPRSFSQYWRGLQLMGWGVFRPEYLGAAYVSVNLDDAAMAVCCN